MKSNQWCAYFFRENVGLHLAYKVHLDAAFILIVDNLYAATGRNLQLSAVDQMVTTRDKKTPKRGLRCFLCIGMCRF